MLSGIKKFIATMTISALVFSALAAAVPTASASASASAGASASASTARNGTINTQGANLREKPATTADVITKMDQGTQVNVLGNESNGWYKIRYQKKTGYTRADYVDVLVSNLRDPAVMISDATMTKQPDPASEAIESLKSDTQVTVTGAYGAMYKVADGQKSGYVPKSCVHIYTIVSIDLKATISSGGVNLRSIPSASGQNLTTMTKGASVTAYSIQDHWVRINYSGKTGYVRGDFVSYSLPAHSNITTLSPGMKGPMVTNLQTVLKKAGYFYAAANGVYGSATKKAVADYQKFAHMKADGIAGAQTLLLLFGPQGAAKLWSNYRSSMPAQKPRQNGRVWLDDWFGYMEKTVKKMEPFEVIDVRTGIHWKMQRFGGWWHADVETMTKADTEAMKKAWGGEMNPSRRPVWVRIGDKYYAASLMGFIHNRGTIYSNGLGGQVCLHFRGSRIHESGHIDEAHQACVMEAYNKAARLDALIDAGKV